MRSYETSMGGKDSRFPTTTISMILAARESNPEFLRMHMEKIISRYWKPIYSYIRRAWSSNDQDAKDQTQDFFLRLVEKDVLDQFDPGRGNFRSFIKKCLKNRLLTNRRAEQRQKRGGGKIFVSLEHLMEKAGDAFPSDDHPPDDMFDREWIQELLNQAVSELETTLRADNRGDAYEVFRMYDLEEESSTYREIGKKLGMEETRVGNTLYQVRQKLRQIVLSHIREYVVEGDGLVAEESLILGDPP